jgi:hypothetical protein
MMRLLAKKTGQGAGDEKSGSRTGGRTFGLRVGAAARLPSADFRRCWGRHCRA